MYPLAAPGDLGGSDCEFIHDGFLAQPVNAISSLAFSLVGLVILLSVARHQGVERRRRLVFGTLMILTGLGSFLFHGPQWPGSHWLHDMSFLAVLWFLAVVNVADAYRLSARTTLASFLGGVTLLGVARALFPDLTNVLAAAAVITLIAADIAVHRRGGVLGRWYLLAVVLIAFAVAAFLIGRSDSSFCDPEGVLQGHAGWHILAAFSLGAYFIATSRARLAGRRPERTTA